MASRLNGPNSAAFWHWCGNKSSHELSQQSYRLAAVQNPSKIGSSMIEIALYQPDIAPNAATIARLCACFGLKLTIIEPAGFVFSDSAFRRAGMDYLNQVDLVRSPSWSAFQAANAGRRIVLLTTKAAQTHITFRFEASDILLMGRESAGVPDLVRDALPYRLRIPMRPETRSLNVALAASMVAGEAMRQLRQFPTVPVDGKVPIANLGEP